MIDIARELDLARNMYGHLTNDVRARLAAVVENPSQDTWDDAYSILLWDSPFVTLWQAVISVDPTFPKSGPSSGGSGDTAWRDPWSRVPDRATLVEALRYATH